MFARRRCAHAEEKDQREEGEWAAVLAAESDRYILSNLLLHGSGISGALLPVWLLGSSRPSSCVAEAAGGTIRESRRPYDTASGVSRRRLSTRGAFFFLLVLSTGRVGG